MEWKDDTERTDRTLILEDSGIRFSVDDDEEERWTHFQLSFGLFDQRKFSECLDAWPREAIAECRRRLDEFEKRLTG